MREMSRAKKPFAFTFMSFSRTEQKTNGITEVHKARLITKKKTDRPEDDVMERYFDDHQGAVRQFYICNLMTFQGQKVELI